MLFFSFFFWMCTLISKKRQLRLAKKKNYNYKLKKQNKSYTLFKKKIEKKKEQRKNKRIFLACIDVLAFTVERVFSLWIREYMT